MVTPYKPAQDGIRYYSENLIGGFSNLSEDLEIKIATWNYQNKIARIFLPILGVFSLAWRIARSDVVHIQYVASLYLHNLILILLLAKLLGSKTKIVLTLHETNEHTPLPWLFEMLESWYRKVANKLITHTDYHKSSLPESAEEKTHVIPHGVPQITQDIRHGDSNLVLIPGFINEWKGHDVALEGIAQLDSDIQVLIAGKPHNAQFFAEITRKAKGLGLSDQVTFETDFLTEKQFRDNFRRAGVILLPYRRIAMSGILSHAIAFETPTVMSDLSPFKEYIGEKGVYFENEDPEDLADKLSELVENEELRKEQIELFRELKERYDYTNVARQTLEIYKS